MPIDIMQFFAALSGMGGFGKGLGVVAGIIVIYFMLRRYRNEDDAREDEMEAKARLGLREELAVERDNSRRFFSSARWWFDRASRERMDRERDRLRAWSLIRAATPDFEWPPLPEMEPFAEESERPK